MASQRQLPSKPKIVFFDAGNVLFRKRTTEAENIARTLGFDSSEYENLIQHLVTVIDPTLDEEFWQIDTLEKEINYLNRLHQVMCKHLGIKPTEELINQLTNFRIKGDYVLNEGVLEVLNKMTKMGFRLGVITNALPSRRHHEMKLKGLDRFFELLIISFEVSLHKPDPRIYQLAVSKAGVENNEVLYLDDKEECLEGAEKAGIKNLIRFGSKKKPSRFLCIASFENLITLLKDEFELEISFL